MAGAITTLKWMIQNTPSAVWSEDILSNPQINLAGNNAFLAMNSSINAIVLNRILIKAVDAGAMEVIKGLYVAKELYKLIHVTSPSIASVFSFNTTTTFQEIFGPELKAMMFNPIYFNGTLISELSLSEPVWSGLFENINFCMAMQYTDTEDNTKIVYCNYGAKTIEEMGEACVQKTRKRVAFDSSIAPGGSKLTYSITPTTGDNCSEWPIFQFGNGKVFSEFAVDLATVKVSANIYIYPVAYIGELPTNNTPTTKTSKLHCPATPTSTTGAIFQALGTRPAAAFDAPLGISNADTVNNNDSYTDGSDTYGWLGNYDGTSTNDETINISLT